MGPKPAVRDQRIAYMPSGVNFMTRSCTRVLVQFDAKYVLRDLQQRYALDDYFGVKYAYSLQQYEQSVVYDTNVQSHLLRLLHMNMLRGDVGPIGGFVVYCSMVSGILALVNAPTI